jgi:tetratricopeptide (TPR) repeat protein
MLTDIYEHETNYTAAIELLENQIEQRVNPAQVHVRLAQLYIKKNDEDKAADHFQLALKLDPSNRDARDGLNRMDLVGSRPGVHHDDTANGSFDAMDLALEEEEINDMDQADSELESAVWNGPHDAVLGRSN